jgi:hypothetical protein
MSNDEIDEALGHKRGGPLTVARLIWCYLIVLLYALFINHTCIIWNFLPCIEIYMLGMWIDQFNFIIISYYIYWPVIFEQTYHIKYEV